MNWTKATNEQLKIILSSDNGIPTHLAVVVSEELIRRNMWGGIITYTAKLVYKNAEYVIKHILNTDWQEFFHMAHIEIMERVNNFTAGTRTLKTYMVMCLKSKFLKMRRDAMREKRRAHIGSKDVDALDEKIRERIFQAPTNVERTVINRIMIEKSWGVLREIEKTAILLELAGYEQYEIAEMIGVHKRHGNTLLKRAYAKLRKQMGA